LIEAVMLVTLGFLSATLIALAAVPALARRADRLARRRAEAAFPLSLAEISADRDYLRAELALRERVLEQQAERGFQAKAVAMQEAGRRDMENAALKREIAARLAAIAELEADLAATRETLSQTQAALLNEQQAHRETTATLQARLADLAAVEQSLAEERAALKRLGTDLAARSNELAGLRDVLERGEAALAEREQELATLRTEADGLRVAMVEGRTRHLVLEADRDDLARKLAASESTLAAARTLHHEEAIAMQEQMRERDERLEVLHAEIQTLQGALAQSREDRLQLKREIGHGQGGEDRAALRAEISRVAEQLLAMPHRQEAAE
jgi:chromosome segregation ATPase